MGATAESARDPPLATRRRARPDSRRAVSSAAGGPGSLGRGSALGSRADERRRAHHALERPHCHARGHRSRITGLARWIRESCERLARRTPGQSVPRRRRRRAPSSERLKPAHRGASCGPACIWPKTIRRGSSCSLGDAQLAMLDVLTGRTAEVRVTYRAPERFRRRRELGCELENHGLLLVALAPLLAELGDFLAARDLGVVKLECRLMHRHAPPTRCVVRLASPATDVQRLTALLGEHLSALELPEPVRACELAAAALVPHRPESESLWQPGERGGSFGKESCDLIERLRARLGAEAVYGLTRLPAHRPEKAWAVAEPPSASTHRAQPGCSADSAPARRRPVWLLPAPQRLSVRDGLPRRRGPLRLVSEPERIETGWWDGDEIARDYYTAVDIHGVHLWVFRERAAPHDWFLHGVFG